MGYSNYRKYEQIYQRFKVDFILDTLFPEKIDPISPSIFLVENLKNARKMPLLNEKARSERLISPVLIEVSLLHGDKVTLFSGEELSVNPQEDLNGPCDFFFAAKPKILRLSAPIVALAEAKNEDMEWGVSQCAAQMIAAYRYNQQENQAREIVWGCATTGDEWKFLKLDGQNITVDTQSYYLDQIQDILGVFHHILSQI